MLEHLLLLLQHLLDNLAVPGRDPVGVEVDDFVLDTPRAEKLSVPPSSCIRIIHERENGFEQRKNTFWGRPQRFNLVDVVGLNLSNCRASRINEGLNILQFVLDAPFW